MYAGNHGRLALLLYASGSVYDLQVQADLADGKTVVAEQDPDIVNGEVTSTTSNGTAMNTLIYLLQPILP